MCSDLCDLWYGGHCISCVLRFTYRGQPAVAVVPMVEEVPFEDEADEETDSQLRARYLRDPMEELSDPETWHRIRYGVDSPVTTESGESTDQPHDPVASAFIEAMDITQEQVGNVAVCCFLMERATRRYRQAVDGGADRATIRYYTDVVNTLDNSFTRFESGELNDNSVETRNILREFARFSPRADSPTAAMTMEQMVDEMRRYQNNQNAPDDEARHRRENNDMEVDDDGENQPMDLEMEENLNGVHNNGRVAEAAADRAVEYGPMNQVDSISADIVAQRDRMLREIEDHLAEATSQEEIWYWEAQCDWWWSVP